MSDPEDHSTTPARADEMIRAHYQMQHGLFVSQFQADGQWATALSRVAPGPMWNHLAHLGSEVDLADLDSKLQPFSALDRRPIIYLVEDLAGAAESTIAAAGFERFDAELWMVHQPGETSAPRPGSYKIVEINSTGLSDFVDVFYQSFSIVEPGYASALQAATSNVDGKVVRNFVAYDGKQPVCCATYIQLGDLACVYNVGTIPSYRGRGCAAQIMSEILRIAREHEPRMLFLQVERNAPAERLYRKLGFKELFARVGYRLKDWKPHGRTAALTSSRPALSILLGGGHGVAQAAEVSFVRDSAAVVGSPGTELEFAL